MFKPELWQSHDEYRTIVKTYGKRLSRNPKYAFKSYEKECRKLLNLNLDAIADYIPRFYSPAGRPAKNQAQTLRSLILFVLLFNRTSARTSLTIWVRETLPASISLTVLVGCTSPDDLPPLASYYDFMNRFWLASRRVYSRTSLLPAVKNSQKPDRVIGSNGELAEDGSSVSTADIVKDILEGKPACLNPEATLLFPHMPPLMAAISLPASTLAPSVMDAAGTIPTLTLPGAGTATMDAHKYRCPLKCGRISSCPYADTCSPGSYGRTVYISNHADLRFHPRIPRDSQKFKDIYNERTACERVNDRVLNDYSLQQLMIRGRDHFSFWAMLIGICIHLDARCKAGFLRAA